MPMTLEEVKSAFAMPICSVAYPRGPYKFINREFFIFTYETDLEALAAIVPEPLEVTDPIVKYEFIRMPDSSGFGNYCESGQVIPIRYNGKPGSYTHVMYLDDYSPIAGGREIWGFPKKLAKPKVTVHSDTINCTLDYNDMRIAQATMGFKYQELDQNKIYESMQQPNFLIKLIPHVDGTPRICELVKFYLQDLKIKGAWTSPGSLELFQHALAPVALLPVKKVISAVHLHTDLTLPYGEVAFDYLA